MMIYPSTVEYICLYQLYFMKRDLPGSSLDDGLRILQKRYPALRHWQISLADNCRIVWNKIHQRPRRLGGEKITSFSPNLGLSVR